MAPARELALWIRVLALGAAALLAGCVSTKYQMADKDTPPPRAIQLSAEAPALKATVETVILYNGPGAWKKEAYWDEYTVTLANRADAPLTIQQARVLDALDGPHEPGADPWELEKQSRETLRRFEHTGRKIALGAGLAVGWALTPGIGYAAALASVPAVAVGAMAAFVAIPVWAVTKGVRTHSARSAIRKEFDRRRLVLPATLLPGGTRTGSLFFSVAPGPKRLEVTYLVAGRPRVLVLDLTPLGPLHEDVNADARPARAEAVPSLPKIR